jgi:ABC-2 type transport system ATP-binding protein
MTGDLHKGPTTTTPVLHVDTLEKRFGDRHAVNGVSFTIQPGETYGLLGPNGAGKTTVIRMVCGLLRPDAGEVIIDGRSPWLDRSVKNLVGFVPQDIALFGDLTARENLCFFGRLYGLRRKDLKEAVKEALEVVDLSDRADERVEGFSGGMKRRLNIAAGLVHKPTLLVLDEPTVGVDPQSRHAILDRVASLRERGVAVLYTTHYMEEAERVCDRIGIVDHGCLVAEGTRRELLAGLGERDRVELGASGNLVAFAAECRILPGVTEADATADGLHLLAKEGRRVLPSVFEAAEHAGVEVTSVEVVEPDLEAVFLHLTGTALRE